MSWSLWISLYKVEISHLRCSHSFNCWWLISFSVWISFKSSSFSLMLSSTYYKREFLSSSSLSRSSWMMAASSFNLSSSEHIYSFSEMCWSKFYVSSWFLILSISNFPSKSCDSASFFRYSHQYWSPVLFRWLISANKSIAEVLQF